MPKARCAGCDNYFDRDTMKRNSVQSFCSEECINKVRDIPARKPMRTVKKKPDIPVKLRKEVLVLDGKKCRFCSVSNEYLYIHHVLYRSEGGEHEQSNLISLCLRHHNLVHTDKKRYQPLCLGVIWLRAINMDKQITIPRLERQLKNAKA